MTQPASVALPRQLAFDTVQHENPIQQILILEHLRNTVSVSSFGGTGNILGTDSQGKRIVMVKHPRQAPSGVGAALVIQSRTGRFSPTLQECHADLTKWITPKASKVITDADPRAVRASWRDSFKVIEEEVLSDGSIVPGLRPPQTGALYATLAHWTVSKEAATIVMPTGTGKTETMLTLLVNQGLERVLVVVPSDALRSQLYEKFLTLGLLPTLKLLSSAALFPVVGCLKKRPKTPDEAEAIFGPCNVVVTTMDLLSGCPAPVLERMVKLCSHLFIDEAHHIAAPTWEKVKRAFQSKIILQFTATPFRNDRKTVEGKVIYNYPLHKAQAEGYFKPIEFQHVWEFNPAAADQAIAAKAIEALEHDVSSGKDHLIMARCKSIQRAQEVLALYEGHAPWKAVLVHSQLSKSAKHAAPTQLQSRQARILVCVDMFGEGYDFPELKIAALHDIHKSLAITLQFTGRFTRSKPQLGQAKMIANLADADVIDALKELYAEDADWNTLLQDLSAGAVGAHQRTSEFFRGFQNPPSRVALQNVTPKMSAVAYLTQCADWTPEKIKEVMLDAGLLEAPAIHPRERVALFVTYSQTKVDWANARDLKDTEWNLYLVHWDEGRKLLFIHSSETGTLHPELALAVGGAGVELVKGEQVFRTLHGINRLTLTNLGLSHTMGRAMRFTMFMGSDVLLGLAEAHQLNKTKSNIFGFGFRNAERASAGCSAKGKLWSYKVAGNIQEWMDWCHAIGDKLLDTSIHTDDLLSKVVKYEPLAGRPTAVPLALEWSPEVLERPETAIEFEINGDRVYLYDVGLELLTFDETSPIRFQISTETQNAVYEMRFVSDKVLYHTSSGSVTVFSGKKSYDLDTWFQKEPPTVFFNDRSLIQYHLLARLTPVTHAYDPAHFQTWDWTGTDIERESQGLTRDADTVQYRVIQEVKASGFDVVFDDDSSGEAADVVALRERSGVLEVHLYHCKFSGRAASGARVDDVYEVCGQAQKSVRWRESSGAQALFKHLKNRELQRKSKHSASRFEEGDLVKLEELKRKATHLRLDFHIFIVQPGLSQVKATPEQLHVLATTELYLQESYAIPFTVIASP